MKGFIEVTYDGNKIIINVSEIQIISKKATTGEAKLYVRGWGEIIVNESYEEVKQKIAEASK